MKKSNLFKKAVLVCVISIGFTMLYAPAHSQQIGWTDFKNKASQAYKRFPSDAQIAKSKMSAGSKKEVADIKRVLRGIADVKGIPTTEKQKEYFGQVHQITPEIQTVARDNDPRAGTTVPTCDANYQQCLNESHCDDSGLICLCCVPCSLELAGCIGGTLLRNATYHGVKSGHGSTK